jgi:hypothetical protein
MYGLRSHRSFFIEQQGIFRAVANEVKAALKYSSVEALGSRAMQFSENPLNEKIRYPSNCLGFYFIRLYSESAIRQIFF